MPDQYPDPKLLINHLWRPDRRPGGGRIYALVDAAQDGQIFRTLLRSNNPNYCLYQGDLPRVMAEAAPYLVQLEKNFALTGWLLGQGWGRNWAVYLESAADLEELRHHFRKFLMAQDERKKRFYFRFYDPRVLRVYLPTCNEAELAAIFGPVSRYCLEGRDYYQFLEYTRANSKLAESVTDLKATAVGAAGKN